MERSLVRCLKQTSGERAIHKFLKANCRLVEEVFQCSPQSIGTCPEFKLGADFRCDFLVVGWSSAWWDATFVELKSPNARLYLRDGSPAESLRKAQAQIRNWKSWIKNHDTELRERMAKMFAELNTHATGSCNLGKDAAEEIMNPTCRFVPRYAIVIGRRDKLERIDQSSRGMEYEETGTAIVTYDRFVDKAHQLDERDRR